MNDWDEINTLKVDAKNDMLMQAFEYAYHNKVDTVEMEIEFENGMAINAKVTFDISESMKKQGENA